MHVFHKTLLFLFPVALPLWGNCQENKPKYEGKCGRIIEVAGLCEGGMRVSKLINGCAIRTLTAKLVLITEDSLLHYTNKELMLYKIKAQDTILLGCSGCMHTGSKKICYEYRVTEETYE